jgi:hypothetical protein
LNEFELGHLVKTGITSLVYFGDVRKFWNFANAFAAHLSTYVFHKLAMNAARMMQYDILLSIVERFPSERFLGLVLVADRASIQQTYDEMSLPMPQGDPLEKIRLLHEILGFGPNELLAYAYTAISQKIPPVLENMMIHGFVDPQVDLFMYALQRIQISGDPWSFFSILFLLKQHGADINQGHVAFAHQFNDSLASFIEQNLI